MVPIDGESRSKPGSGFKIREFLCATIPSSSPLLKDSKQFSDKGADRVACSVCVTKVSAAAQATR